MKPFDIERLDQLEKARYYYPYEYDENSHEAKKKFKILKRCIVREPTGTPRYMIILTEFGDEFVVWTDLLVSGYVPSDSFFETYEDAFYSFYEIIGRNIEQLEKH